MPRSDLEQLEDGRRAHVRVSRAPLDDENYCVTQEDANGALLVNERHPTVLIARRRALALARNTVFRFATRAWAKLFWRDADHLDEPLPSWARRLGWLTRPIPEPPDDLQGRHQWQDGRCVIDLPPVPFQWRHMVAGVWMSISAAVLIGAFWFIANEDGGKGLFILGVGIISVIVLLLLAAYVFGYTARQRIEADSKRLQVTTRWGPWVRSRSLPAEPIQELVVCRYPRDAGSFPGQEPIFALTSTGELHFAYYLPRAERLWLREMLVRVLAGNSP